MNTSDDKYSLLEKAFAQYHDGMVLYAFQFMGNEKDSEDVVQELYLKLWETKPLVFDSEKALKTYLYRSIRNSCIKKIEKKDTLKYTIDIINQDIWEDLCYSFDEESIKKILIEIGKLPERTQKIFTSVFLDGEKYQQVADDLGISINTVKTLLKKGIKKIRESFNGREALFLSQLIYII